VRQRARVGGVRVTGIVVLSLLLMAAPIGAAFAATIGWSTKTPMPTARKGLVAAEVKGEVYAIGGWNDRCMDAVEQYDPSTDTWAARSPLPTAVYAPAAAVASGIVYVFGGNYDDPLFGHTVQAYDPRTDSWTAKSPMPTGRYRTAAVELNGLIYVIGGECNGTDSTDYSMNTVEEYNPRTDTWTTKAPLLTGRTDLAAAVIGNKIYAVGGFGDSNDWATNSGTWALEEYDPKTNIWTKKSPLPTPRKGLRAVAIDGKLYAIGGRAINGEVATVEEYDPQTDTWSDCTPMLTARQNLAAVAVGKSVLALGGVDNSISGPYLDTVEEGVIAHGNGHK
jgi:N-acetylneuraminic acid mutarotase